jgi:hypothetical protein
MSPLARGNFLFKPNKGVAMSATHEVKSQVKSAELVTYNCSQKNSANKQHISASNRQSLGKGFELKR